MGKVATNEVITAVCAGTPIHKVSNGIKKKPPPPPSIVPKTPITKPIDGKK
jgi:hypothetical protein